MKKLTALILVLVMALGLMAGCGNEAGTGADDGKIEKRAFLAAVGRREIDHQIKIGEEKSAVFDRASDAFLRFLDCGVGKSDQLKPRPVALGVALDRYYISVNAG